MSKHTLEIQLRKDFGRKVKTLRKQGLLPANLYGKKIKSKALQVNLVDFLKVHKEAGETGLIELKIKAKTSKKVDKVTVLISDIQTNPVTDEPIHVDFRKVDLKEKITASVPVVTFGESPAANQGLGTVVVHIDQIEVEALPQNLPEKFEVDLGKLVDVDQAVHIKDISIEKSKVDIKTDPEEIVVKIEPLRAEEEEPVVVEETEDGDQPEGESAEEGEEEKAEDSTEEKKEEKENSKE